MHKTGNREHYIVTIPDYIVVVRQQIYEEYIDFVLEVLLVVSEKETGSQALYPLLEGNLKKLNSNFATVLQAWAIDSLSEVEPEQSQDIAVVIGNFSNQMLDFPLGRRIENLKIAITGYEIAATVFTQDKNYGLWKINCGNWAKAYYLLGNIYRQQRYPDEAEYKDKAILAYQSALKAFTPETFPEEWASTQENQGVTYLERIQGDRVENLEAAIVAFRLALKVHTYRSCPENWAMTLSNLANAYSLRIRGNKAKNQEAAIAALRLVLKKVFTREKFPEKWASTLGNLGNTYCQRLRGNTAKNIEEAINAYRLALEVFKRKTFPESWAKVQCNLGGVYCSRAAHYKEISGDWDNDLEAAMTSYQLALQVYTPEAFPEMWAGIQFALGLISAERGQASEAIKYLESALKISKPTTCPRQIFLPGINLGRVASCAGLWSEAIQGYAAAIEAVETSRRWATWEFRRQEILADALSIYENMVQACINAGKLDKAIEYVERSRSKRLVDLMASNDLYQSGEIPPEVKELLQQYDNLQERIDRERSSYDAGNNRELMRVGTSTVDRASFQAYNEAIAKRCCEAQIATLEAEKLQVWEQLRRFDPVLAGEIQVTPLKFDDIQKLIDQPTTAILSFYTTSTDTHIFVLRQNKITLHTCTGQGVETLQKWIFQNWLMPYVSDRKTWESQINTILSELSQRLQLPELISKHLEGIEELIIVPHLLLHQIPFAALPIVRENLTPPCPPSPLLAGDRSVSEELGERSKYLGDKFLIRYTPSCQILEFCHQRGNVETFNETSLQYGTVEDAEDNLPCASFEGEQIAQLCDIPQERRLIGSTQATCNNYRQLVQKIQVLHSCHHAQSRLDNPLESQLKLADGSITLGQLMTPGWRLPNLSDVFLSCCETNLGDPSITDDILTLSTGFLCAGARSVVSTLWSVEDLPTALFSTFYYQQRQQIKSRPEALQQAQIKLRQLKKEELAELSMQVTAKEKELIRERKNYPDGSAGRVEWERDYKKYAGVARRINTIKNSPEEFPFSHPKFWAAFTCQGLK
jgi:CHAT domain-containing protein